MANARDLAEDAQEHGRCGPSFVPISTGRASDPPALAVTWMWATGVPLMHPMQRGHGQVPYSPVYNSSCPLCCGTASGKAAWLRMALPGQRPSSSRLAEASVWARSLGNGNNHPSPSGLSCQLPSRFLQQGDSRHAQQSRAFPSLAAEHFQTLQQSQGAGCHRAEYLGWLVQPLKAWRGLPRPHSCLHQVPNNTYPCWDAQWEH